MHYFESNDVVFHFNGDYSGDVIITRRYNDPTKDKGHSVTIPFDAIKDLVATYVSSNIIAKLEQLSSDDLLLGHYVK